MVKRLVANLTLGLLVLVVVAGPARGHGGMGPWIEVVPAYAEPGGALSVRGDDLDPHDRVEVMLSAGGEMYELGSAEADEQGHFVVDTEVPAAASSGDAYVQVETAAGWAASLWLEIGQQPEAGEPAVSAPPPPSAPPPLADPSVWMLALFMGGAAVGAAIALLRRSRAPERRPTRAGRRAPG